MRSPAPNPKVVIGVPLYSQAEHLPETLESLLSQTYRDFVLVLVDDGSTDNTAGVAQKYAALDPRVIYERNPVRLGMHANWRRAFELARERFPGMEYFAWGSDHDVWHPRWLAALVQELERRPEVALAYPFWLRISEKGDVILGPRPFFDTLGDRATLSRLARVCESMSAGNMVYGVFRASILARAGTFRRVLLPDRLLLTEVSLYGEFKQVREILWYRRFSVLVSAERQRAALFPDAAPLHTHLPFWLVHPTVLLWNFVVRGDGRPEIDRRLGLSSTLICLRTGLQAHLERHAGRAMRSWLEAARMRQRQAVLNAREIQRRVYERLSRRVPRRFSRGLSRWLRTGPMKPERPRERVQAQEMASLDVNRGKTSAKKKAKPKKPKWGDEIRTYLVELCQLQPDDAVLDVGCGGGGPALALTGYLSARGRYEGLDIQPGKIERARKILTTKHPNFNLRAADIYNAHYNPTGKYTAAEYTFPFGDETFDVVFLKSVFTHMLPKDIENYLGEISRVLKRGGRCLMTYFLINAEAERLIASNTDGKMFPYHFENYRAHDKDVHERAIALDEEFVRNLYARYGLSILAIHYGRWSGRERGLTKQDLIVAVKQE